MAIIFMSEFKYFNAGGNIGERKCMVLMLMGVIIIEILPAGVVPLNGIGSPGGL